MFLMLKRTVSLDEGFGPSEGFGVIGRGWSWSRFLSVCGLKDKYVFISVILDTSWGYVTLNTTKHLLCKLYEETTL